jgi:aminoglycoside phosphotransferase (APT) family kinase protein
MNVDVTAGDTVSESPPGIDVSAVTDWLVDRLPELEPPLQFRRVGEGQSNLTYRVDAASGGVVVLRRPPLGEILQSAHDVVREHRVLTGLASTGAKVPRTLAVCEDPQITGAPFYVMEHVDGLILNHVSTAARLTAGERATAGRSMATTLVELHSIDLTRAGLDDLRRPESLASRQLRRWTRQWHASKTEELALIDELAEELAARLPAEAETALVHGDYHLHNAIFAPDGTVRAVLDWELCTVGDPLADVGVMIAYWNELGAAANGFDALFREPVTELAGFQTASELAGIYARASGRDLTPLGFWVAFAYWKIAIIVEGVYRRWLNDPANGSDAGSLRPAVTRLAGLAHEALERPESRG